MSVRSRRFLKKTCESCGAAEKLEVHHVDRNHKNDVPSNLKTLCRGCHRSEHRKGPEQCLSGRVSIPMSIDLAHEIDEWRRQQPDLPNRAAAIRRLVRQALGIAEEERP